MYLGAGMKLAETDPTVARTLSIVLRTIVALSLIFLGLATFVFGDETFGTLREGQGVVVNKLEIRGVTPQTAPRAANHGSHQKRICVHIEQRTGCFSVSEEDYQMTNMGTPVNIMYTIGIFTDDLHIKSFRN